MQFDLLRAFPYPVLRPGNNDYIDSDIQTTVHFEQSSDNSKIAAEVEFALSVDEIKGLVKKGIAEYVAVFACRDTYFRRSISSRAPTFSTEFPAGELRGEVVIYPYVVAARDIKNFTCPWINTEFGPGPFGFPNGAVMALDEPQSIYVDRDAFKPISSCFLLVQNEHVPNDEWQISADNDKVQIAVSPSLKGRIDAARNSKENRAILLNSVYFAAVAQCISLLKHETTYDECRWAKIFRQRMVEQNIDINKHHEVWVAQQLMRHPLTLLGTYFFRDKGE